MRPSCKRVPFVCQAALVVSYAPMIERPDARFLSLALALALSPRLRSQLGARSSAVCRRLVSTLSVRPPAKLIAGAHLKVRAI